VHYVTKFRHSSFDYFNYLQWNARSRSRVKFLRRALFASGSLPWMTMTILLSAFYHAWIYIAYTLYQSGPIGLGPTSISAWRHKWLTTNVISLLLVAQFFTRFDLPRRLWPRGPVQYIRGIHRRWSFLCRNGLLSGQWCVKGDASNIQPSAGFRH